MAAKKKQKTTPEEEPEPSRAAGACVLVVVGGGSLAVVWAVSPEAGILTLWAVALGALWRLVRRTANPAPPPLPERGPDEKPQFTVTEDERGRCTVNWQKGVNGS